MGLVLDLTLKHLAPKHLTPKHLGPERAMEMVPPMKETAAAFVSRLLAVQVAGSVMRPEQRSARRPAHSP